MAYKNKRTGEILSDTEYRARFGGAGKVEKPTITPQAPEQQPKEPLGKKIAKGAYEISGAKSMVDLARMPGRAGVGTILATKESQALSANRKQLADYTTNLIKIAREEQDPERVNKLNKIIADNFKVMGKVFEEEKAQEKEIPTQKEIAGTTLKAGMTATAYGTGMPKTIKGAMAQAGALGAGFGTAEALKEEKDPKEIAKQAFGTALASAITAGVVKAGTEKIIKPILQKYPEKLYNSALKATNKLIRKKKTGVDVLIKEGHFGTLGQIAGQVEQGKIAVNKQINSKLVNITEKIESKKVISLALIKLKKKFGATYTKPQVQEIVNKLPIADLLEKKELTLVEANTLRTQTDKILRETYFMSDIQAPIRREALGAISNTLRRTIQKASGTGKEFATYAGYIRSEKLIDKAVAHSDKYFGIGLKDLIIGSAFGMKGGVPGGIAAVATKKIAEAPITKTTIAVGLDRLNKLVQKMPIDKMGKVSRVAVLNLISKLMGDSD